MICTSLGLNMNDSVDTELSTSWLKMIKESTLIDFKQDQVIFYEGHIPYGVFIFVSGHVSLNSKNHPQKKEAPLNVPIGVDSFFDRSPYSNTALAETPVKAYFICSSIIKKYSESC